MAKTLTATTIERKSIPEGGRVQLPGGERGLSVILSKPDGVRRYRWQFRYRFLDRQEALSLGEYPEVDIDTARSLAREYRAMLKKGTNPRQEIQRRLAEEELRREQEEARKLAEAAETVALLGRKWVEALPKLVNRRGKLYSPRTVESYADAMERYIIPAIGERQVSKVARSDVRELHTEVTKAGPTMANRVVSALSTFYGWLLDTEQVPEGFNPTRRAPRNPEQKRGEYASVRLSREQEGRLVRAIYSLIDGTTTATSKRGGERKPDRGRKHADPIGGTAILTLLDTGRRLEEVLGMRWSRLDLEAGTLDLGKTKGKSAGDVCYLSERVCEAIKRLPRIVGNPWVFTGRGASGHRASLQSAWEIVTAEAGLESISEDLEGFHLHDLRHHRISELLAAGVAPQLIIQQVGHTSYDELDTYGHVKVADVAAVLSKLEPVEPAADPEVVDIAARRV